MACFFHRNSSSYIPTICNPPDTEMLASLWVIASWYSHAALGHETRPATCIMQPALCRLHQPPNGVVYKKVLKDLKERCSKRGHEFDFSVQVQTRYEPVASLISRGRCKQLKPYLPFNDNSKAPDRNDEAYDELFK